MKQYILSDGRSKWVSPENEQAFFEQLKKQGLTATLKSDELGKSKGTNQSQNNQQKNIKKVNQNLEVNLDTGEVIKNTESNLEDGSLESPVVNIEEPQYLKIDNNFVEPSQEKWDNIINNTWFKKEENLVNWLNNESTYKDTNVKFGEAKDC
jgi:hypothetical protein